MRREAAPKFEHFDRFAEGLKVSKDSDDPAPRQGSAGIADDTASDAKVGSKRSKGDSSRAENVGSGGSVGGRTHPHFFHGLGPNARQLFIELYAENRSRLLTPKFSNKFCSTEGNPIKVIPSAPSDGSSLPSPVSQQRDSVNSLQQQSPLPSTRSVDGAPIPVGGGRAPSAPSKGSGGASDTMRHAAGAFAASGPPPDIDAAILDRHDVFVGRLVEAATRVQRIRRLGGLPRAARRLRRRQRAALAVQRFFRGHLGRRYVVV